MHTLMVLLALAVLVVGSYLQSKLLMSLSALRISLLAHFLALATAPLALGLLFRGLPWETIPTWDGHVWHEHTLVYVIAWSAAAVAVTALALSLARTVLVMTLARRYPEATDPALINSSHRLASRLGICCPTIRVYDSAYPVAAACGVRGLGGQTILLSSWIISNLDEEEKEAVLTHEMAHLRRRDGLLIWLAQLMRDIAFYVPGMWQVRRGVQLHMQVAADELAIKVTGRPDALASAICKVQQQALHLRAKPRWAFHTTLLSTFSSSGDMWSRVALLTGERIDFAEGRARVANPLRQSLFASIALLQMLTILGLYFLLCCFPHQELLAMLILPTIFGMIMGLNFLRHSRRD